MEKPALLVKHIISWITTFLRWTWKYNFAAYSLRAHNISTVVQGDLLKFSKKNGTEFIDPLPSGWSLYYGVKFFLDFCFIDASKSFVREACLFINFYSRKWENTILDSTPFPNVKEINQKLLECVFWEKFCSIIHVVGLLLKFLFFAILKSTKLTNG